MNWVVRRRSSAVPHSLLVVGSPCGHNWCLCFRQMGQSWRMWWTVCSASLQSQSAESMMPIRCLTDINISLFTPPPPPLLPRCTDAGPASPSADPVTPGARQSIQQRTKFQLTGITRSGKVRFNPRVSRSRGGRLTTRPPRRPNPVKQGSKARLTNQSNNQLAGPRRYFSLPNVGPQHSTASLA